MQLNPFARKRRRRRAASVPVEAGWLTPYAKKAVVGIVLLVIALIALLSVLDMSGPLGEGLQKIFVMLFGWLGYVAPAGLIVLGGYLIWPQWVALEKLRVIGLALALLGLLGLLHTWGVSDDDVLQAAYDGRGGGFVGFLLSFPLSQALSSAGAAIIFLGAFFIGLILICRLSPADIWDRITGTWARDSQEEVGEEETERTPRFRVSPVLKAPVAEEIVASESPEASDKSLVKRNLGRRYRPAILQYLQESSTTAKLGKDDERSIKEAIKRTLENFGINVDMGGTNVGPTVTQFTLRPEEGIKLSRITALQNDLALSLAAHPIRIEAPIPNTNLVGIEIPNKAPSLVRLRGLLTSHEFKEAETPLTFPMGLDVSGKVVVESLARLPHLLIAGATGAGKSVCIHSLLISWLYRNSPEALKLILVDPKRVELTPYNGIPHLLSPVIVDTEKTINALKWAIEEMETRYRLLEDSGSRNLPSFNLNNPTEAKPYIVIVIDELADLMVKHAREVEGPIVRLSQMARAVGIHLVLATQRPSVNVLTGLIKANVSSRVAFTVASQVDSRTILDMAGAEKLVGRGDMLYLAGDRARPVRIQGGFVSEEEVRNVVDVIKASGDPEYDTSITSVVHGGGSGGSQGGRADDPLFEEAKKLVQQAGKASASLLQRRLSIGYARAARLLDMLEDKQVIGVAEGNKPRSVLMEASSENETMEEETAGTRDEGDLVEGEERPYQDSKW
jgi:S-DNA-T family DNA segregation ATPase FtsK/SpoIIIE